MQTWRERSEITPGTLRKVVEEQREEIDNLRDSIGILEEVVVNIHAELNMLRRRVFPDYNPAIASGTSYDNSFSEMTRADLELID